MENLICIVFMDFKKNLYKIIKFASREVAKEYYRVALRKSNFRYAGLLSECENWCKKNNLKYEIILREEYNLYE